MGTKNKQGVSREDELKHIWKTTGKKPAELEQAPELDPMFAESWSWFIRLNRKRQSNGMGINPLSFSDIDSFFNLIQYRPQEWELDAIDMFDEAALDVMSKEMEKQNNPKSSKKK